MLIPLILQNLQAASGIAASSATTNGADVALANVGPVVSTSSATSNGADTAAGQAGPVISLSSATTDGADTAAATASPTIEASSAINDGSDAFVANVAPQSASIDISSATIDGPDVLAAGVDVAGSAPIQVDGGGIDPEPLKAPAWRYVPPQPKVSRVSSVEPLEQLNAIAAEMRLPQTLERQKALMVDYSSLFMAKLQQSRDAQLDLARTFVLDQKAKRDLMLAQEAQLQALDEANALLGRLQLELEMVDLDDETAAINAACLVLAHR